MLPDARPVSRPQSLFAFELRRLLVNVDDRSSRNRSLRSLERVSSVRIGNSLRRNRPTTPEPGVLGGVAAVRRRRSPCPGIWPTRDRGGSRGSGGNGRDVGHSSRPDLESPPGVTFVWRRRIGATLTTLPLSSVVCHIPIWTSSNGGSRQESRLAKGFGDARQSPGRICEILFRSFRPRRRAFFGTRHPPKSRSGATP